MNLPDGALVARITAGDEEALAEAFDRYGPLVFGLARRVTGDAALAEDIAQEIFTALWIHPDRFDAARGSLRAYLGVQAHRRAVDTIRRDARRTAREDHHELLTTRSAPADDFDTAAVQTIVRDAVDRLPEEQRQVVELAYYRGYTQRELASMLGIPEGTAKSRLRLAQTKLGTWLAPEMLELA